MTTLSQMKQVVNTLSQAERDELREYIEQQTLKSEIEAMLQNHTSQPLQGSELDMAQLTDAVEALWSGLSEDDIEAIISSMNDKNTKSS